MDNIPDGYTRISQILAIFQAYAFVPRDKLKKAQEIGTDIHEAIESYFSGNFQPLEFRKAPYMESFLKWANTVEIEPIVVEKRFYDHPMQITGRIDLLAKVNGEVVLIDFKTGSWAHPEIWKLQGTFYRMLLNHSSHDYPLPDKFLFVQLMKDGSDPMLYQFDYKADDVVVCLAAYRLYHFFQSALAKNPEPKLE